MSQCCAAMRQWQWSTNTVSIARWSQATGIKRRVLLLEDSCQLTPTTLWHFSVTPLSVSLLPLKEKWAAFCSGNIVPDLGGGAERRNNCSLSPCLSFALFTHNCILLCVLMREGQSVACALERQSLASLCWNGMFSQPYRFPAPRAITAH